MESFNTEETELKVVFQGNTAVGKTSIIERYVKGNFADNTQSTCGAMFFSKVLYYNKDRVKLQLWDTAGQEKFKAITPLYYRDAQGILVVVDANAPIEKFLDQYKDWQNEIKGKADASDYVVCLIANKSDQLSEQQFKIVEDAIKEFAASVKCSYILTSAKSGKNIEGAFGQIVEDWMKKTNLQNFKSQTQDKKKSKLLTSNTVEEPSQSKCAC